MTATQQTQLLELLAAYHVSPCEAPDVCAHCRIVKALTPKPTKPAYVVAEWPDRTDVSGMTDTELRAYRKRTAPAVDCAFMAREGSGLSVGLRASFLMLGNARLSAGEHGRQYRLLCQYAREERRAMDLAAGSVPFADDVTEETEAA